MPPRWRKVLRDLALNWSRTLLIVLALSVSLFGSSAVLSAYAVLTREIGVNYLGTHPASATLHTDWVDAAVLAALRTRPGIAAVAARRTVHARVQVGTHAWQPILLFVVDDFNALKISTFSLERGAWPPPTGSLLIEQSAIPVLQADLGSTLKLEIPGGMLHVLPVSGIVHDPGQSPGWMDGVGYGYITTATLPLLGLDAKLNEIKLVVAERMVDVPHIEAIAQDTSAWLATQGHSVTQIELPPPAQHPHQAQMTALLVLLGVFSLLALLLSAMLVASIITTLLAQQVRQIGMMKAVGAQTWQIFGMYLGMVVLFSLMALAIGVPSGMLAGRIGAASAADLLNFTITSFRLPAWVFLVQMGSGLLVPLCVATIPIAWSSRITVRQAMSEYGGSTFPQPSFSLVFNGRLRRLPRLFMLALQNTFRRHGRLALTLGTLAVGGGIFMTALNVAAAWNQTLDAAFARQRYTIDVRLAQPHPADMLTALARATPGVVRAEAWGYAPTSRAHPGEIDVIHTYPGGIHGGFVLLAPPVSSQLFDLPLVAGRWLQPADTASVVVNQALVQSERDITVGSTLALTLDGRVVKWQVVGVVQELGMPATAYTTYNAFSHATNNPGRAQVLRVMTSDRTSVRQRETAQALEQAFAAAGMSIAATQQLAVLRATFDQHIVILVRALLAMSGVIALVGGLGLLSTMSISVLERRREFGVLRAIGASRRSILLLVVIEGCLVGLLSSMLAILVSLPLTGAVSRIAGQIGLRAGLSFAIAPWGIALWLGVGLVIAALASAVPAWSAARLTVREVLAYE